MSVEMINTGDEIDFGVISATGNLSSMTVMAFINADAISSIESATNAGIIASQYNSGNNSAEGWAIGTFHSAGDGAANCFYYYRGFDVNVAVWGANNTLSTGQVYSVCVTHDASSDENDPILYVDGAAKELTTFQVAIGTVEDASGENLKLGAWVIAGGARRTFDGKIFATYIWNRILTAAEISSIHSARSVDGFESGLLFSCVPIGAAGLQVFDGQTLTNGTNYIIESLNGYQGDPSGDPKGWADTHMAIRG